MSGAAPVLLLSMPQMTDPNFTRTVILLCDYTEQGAFFDGADAVRQREHGCRWLLEQLAEELAS